MFVIISVYVEVERDTSPNNLKAINSFKTHNIYNCATIQIKFYLILSYHTNYKA